MEGMVITLSELHPSQLRTNHWPFAQGRVQNWTCTLEFIACYCQTLMDGPSLRRYTSGVMRGLKYAFQVISPLYRDSLLN